MRNTVLCLLTSLLLLTVSACGGGGGTPVATGSTPVPQTIAGKISLDGVGLGQVTLTVSGGAALSKYNDGNGSYAFGPLANGSYTVTPTRQGYTFTPATKTVTINSDGVLLDFAATAIPTYAVFGNVSSANHRGVAGVTVSVVNAATGVPCGSRITDGNGNYSLVGLLDGSYTVTPSHSDGFAFTPANRSVVIAGGNAAANFSAAVSTFTVSGRVALASGAGLSGVTLTLGAPGSSTVYRTLSDGSGAYALNGIPQGYYMLTPTLSGTQFVPDPFLVLVSGADQTGTDILGAQAGPGSVNVQL